MKSPLISSLVVVVAVGCADNGHDVGYSTLPGAQGTGGSVSSTGAAPGGGGSQQASSGGAVSTGGVGSGGLGVSSGGSAGSPAEDATPPGSGGHGGAPLDASTDATNPFMCGGTLCLSTTCVGPGCGLARCCHSDAGFTCVHGTTPCPGEIPQTTLRCWSGTPTTTFQKACTTNSDCILVKHYNGCCNASVVGLNASAQQAVDGFEQTCGGAPPCGCCCDQVYGEDGSVVSAAKPAIVECLSGACIAYAPL